jgi:hypothetical protein
MKNEQNMTAFEIMVMRKSILKRLQKTSDPALINSLSDEAQRLKRLAFKKGGLSYEEILKLSVM